MAKRGRPPKYKPIEEETAEEEAPFEACGSPDPRDNSTMRIFVKGEAQLMTAAGCIHPGSYVEIPSWIARSLIKEGRAEAAPYMSKPRQDPESAMEAGAAAR